MHVTRVVLDHFRSWRHCLVDFTPGINVLYGRNGLGKTNIVEAIEFLATGTSHRVSSSMPLVERGETSAVVRANVVNAATFEGRTTTFTATIPVKGANRGRINSDKSVYLRDIVGKVRTVVFAPDDQLLVSMDPSRRRDFLDSAGSQLVFDYYDTMQKFGHVAKQRAALLKRMGQMRMEGGDISQFFGELDVWTSSFCDLGMKLTHDRASICERLSADFSSIYADLAHDGSTATLVYKPGFADMAAELGDIAFQSGDAQPVDDVRLGISQHFQRIFDGELAQGRNLIGPHKDDVVFLLDGMPAREYASNGEMWTMALALKMALFKTLGSDNPPILILDDVFSQLDATRRKQIVDFASRQEQVIITVAAESDVPQGIEATMIDVRQVKEDSDAAQW